MVRVAFLHGQKNGSTAEAPAAALGSRPKACQAEITGRAFEVGLTKVRKRPRRNIDASGESSLLARMSDIDRQRVSGVKLLESLGYAFRAGAWHGPVAGEPFTIEADAMHALLVKRADVLEGFTENSPEEAEYAGRRLGVMAQLS